jgi:hypothetical protein
MVSPSEAAAMAAQGAAYCLPGPTWSVFARALAANRLELEMTAKLVKNRYMRFT